MVAGQSSQFSLLTWKNILLQRRKMCVTVFEIILPLFFPLILIIIRNTAFYHPRTIKATTYNEEDIYSCYMSRVFYVPNTTVIEDLMNNTRKIILDKFRYAHFPLKGFANEEDMINYIQRSHKPGHYNYYLDAGIVFVPRPLYMSDLPKDITYSLRMSGQWDTKDQYADKSFNPGPANEWYNVYKMGFLCLKYSLDTAIMEYINSSISLPDIKIQRMPYPPYVRNPLANFVRITIAITTVVGLILSSLQLTKEIVHDREKKLKETMRMMGLSSFVYWFSWFFKGFIYLIITFAITVLIFQAGPNKMFQFSDSSLLFFFYLSYAVSVVSYCFLFSTFFDKANTASYFAGFFFFVTIIPNFALDAKFSDMTKPQKMAICLLNNMAMAFGFTSASEYETKGTGVNWNTFTKPPTVDGDFAFGDAILMLWVDSAIYLLITWYIDGVRPGEYGVPQPFYFPFTKTYWIGGKQIPKTSQEDVDQDPKYFEKEPSGRKIGISMRHLEKVYTTGIKETVAVKDMSLDIFQGQITALLGHNGAGKTTAMSMLTGFIPSTSGSARVNGYDINDDISSVRGSLGMCPQHDILFDTLTVKEHLEFYYKLKGCNKSKMKEDIRNTLRIFKIEEKRTDLARNLSGGQKRKLSVAISLVGGSKVIILDEPTSGMDPGARRQLWDILQKFKEDRTIVLSTHFMDEADVLGDRIAIMADGVVKCCGSSLFLKKLYGAGYHLVMVKEPSCDATKLLETIRSRISSASLESSVGAELSFLLPTEELPSFADLFTDLEENASRLGISGFGISATTMEEVFLKVKENTEVNTTYKEEITDEKHALLQAPGGSSPRSYTTEISDVLDFNMGLEKNTGSTAIFQQFLGLLMKKALHTWRSRFMMIIQLAVPILLTVFGLLGDHLLNNLTQQSQPPLKLDLEPFPNALTTVTQGPNSTFFSENMTEEYENYFRKLGLEVVEYEPRSPSEFNINKFWLDHNQRIGQRPFNSRYVIGFGLNKSHIISYYNGEDRHAIGISLSYTIDFLFKFYYGHSRSIQTINHPFPPIEDNYHSDQGSGLASFKGLTIALCVLFGLSCLVASFGVFHIKEKSSGAKHLQKVSGVGSTVFWSANFTWDFIHYLIPIFLILLCFTGFKIPPYTEENRLGIVFLSLFLFGLASIAWTYLLHFIFRSPAGGTVAMIIINTVAGLFTLLMVTFLHLSPETKSASDAMDKVFMIILPHFCLGKTFTNIYVRYDLRLQCHKDLNQNITQTFLTNEEKCPNDNYLEWDYPGCGRYLLMMSIQWVAFMTLVFLLDSGVIQRFVYRTLCSPNGGATDSDNDPSINPDSDVLEEAMRIHLTQIGDLMTTDKLIIKNLKKTYGVVEHFHAVKGISVGISEQECFGLLGQNGAGKTTTFKMLTGDVMSSSGHAYINSLSVDSQIQQVHRCLGYCPQFDALIDTLTGREILRLYARMRGINEKEISRVINDLLDAVTLTKYADKLCGTYSGGNKRKLSTAIALIGDPPILMLDEPTTGVDPAARRQMWNVLSKVRASGRTLVLTSHSMEECDALCTKIVIMVNGRFVCFGSPQHLKNKFAQGYTLTVRLERDNNGNAVDSGPLCKHISREFPGTEVFDDQQGYLDIHIPHQKLSLAKLFKEMEKTKSEYNVEDYSVHQTSLEQVFLGFTRMQVPPVDRKRACPCCFCCRSKPAS